MVASNKLKPDAVLLKRLDNPDNCVHEETMPCGKRQRKQGKARPAIHRWMLREIVEVTDKREQTGVPAYLRGEISIPGAPVGQKNYEFLFGHDQQA